MSSSRGRPARSRSGMLDYLQKCKNQYQQNDLSASLRSFKKLLFNMYKDKYNYKPISLREKGKVYNWINKLKKDLPDDGRVYLLEAIYWARQGEVQQALDLYLRINQNFPFYQEPYVRHVELLSSQGFAREASLIALHQKSVFRYHPSPIENKTAALIQRYRSNNNIFKLERDFYVWRVIGDKHLHEGDLFALKQGAELYQPTLKNEAFNELFQSVYSHLKKGNLRLAIHQFNIAFGHENVSARGWSPDYYGNNFSILESEDIEKIFMAVAGFRAMYPGWPATELLLATFYARVGLFEESIEVLDELKLQHPRDASAFDLHAQILFARGEPEEAMSVLRDKEKSFELNQPKKYKGDDVSTETRQNKIAGTSNDGDKVLTWNFRLFPALQHWLPETDEYEKQMKQGM